MLTTIATATKTFHKSCKVVENYMYVLRLFSETKLMPFFLHALHTRSIFYNKQSEIQTSHVSYFFEIFDGFCFLEIEKSWFFVS